MLVKGADRNALDNNGKRPIDYIKLPENGEPVEPIVMDIRNALKDTWTVLGLSLIHI